MMLEHLGEPDAAAAVLAAVETVLARGDDYPDARYGRDGHHREPRQGGRRRRCGIMRYDTDAHHVQRTPNMITLDDDEMRTWFGFGVAGNFAGHLEQAGEAADFVNVAS